LAATINAAFDDSSQPAHLDPGAQTTRSKPHAERAPIARILRNIRGAARQRDQRHKEHTTYSYINRMLKRTERIMTHVLTTQWDVFARLIEQGCRHPWAKRQRYTSDNSKNSSRACRNSPPGVDTHLSETTPKGHQRHVCCSSASRPWSAECGKLAVTTMQRPESRAPSSQRSRFDSVARWLFSLNSPISTQPLNQRSCSGYEPEISLVGWPDDAADERLLVRALPPEYRGHH